MKKQINAPINCRGCIHSRPLCHTDHYTYACHYLLDTGRSKECRADGCDKKTIGIKGKRYGLEA